MKGVSEDMKISKSYSQKFRYYSFLCIIIGYFPSAFFFAILFLYPKINLENWPQHSLAWTLLWSTFAYLFCELSPKTSDINMKIIILLAKIPIAAFGAFMLIVFVSRLAQWFL